MTMKIIFLKKQFSLQISIGLKIFFSISFGCVSEFLVDIIFFIKLPSFFNMLGLMK